MLHSESNAYKLFTDSDSIISVFSPQRVVIKTLVTQHFTKESIEELRATSSLWALRCAGLTAFAPASLLPFGPSRVEEHATTLSDLLPSHRHPFRKCQCWV